ncbi:hypothetical protein NKR23_g2366 [Pleurostoma richardsiae]|uniref:Polymer-forming cytoskeletal protein n=1 Tax=Pleurostoma richardsiae TaxID=41990 RepID=A0AA38RQU0_9PEZI|nr:hypothetical protein NKR23_g2366 [Pleurostoma richardsiae]
MWDLHAPPLTTPIAHQKTLSMPKSKGKSKGKERKRRGAAGPASPRPDDLPEIPVEEFEHIMTFDDGVQSVYGASASATDPWVTAGLRSPGKSAAETQQTIESDTSLELTGPLDVDGSVRCLGSVTLTGDFAIRDKIEAYEHININGSLTCGDKVKSMGNVSIYGDVLCRSNLKAFGKLDVVGNLEVEGTLEIWGAITIRGFIKCKSLTAWSSLTTVGDESGYEVEEEEKIWGAKILNRDELQL